jgi:hypothetical protein
MGIHIELKKDQNQISAIGDARVAVEGNSISLAPLQLELIDGASIGPVEPFAREYGATPEYFKSPRFVYRRPEVSLIENSGQVIKRKKLVDADLFPGGYGQSMTIGRKCYAENRRKRIKFNGRQQLQALCVPYTSRRVARRRD